MLLSFYLVGSVYSRDLFTVPAPTSRSAEPCCDKDTLTCYDVDVDPDSLLSEEDLTMNGITLQFSNSVPPNARVYTTSEGDEAIINYNKKTGNIIGTLKTHDGKAFALEKCGNNYIFEEFDVEAFPTERKGHEELLSRFSRDSIVDTNMTMDRNEIATYSVMFYVTPEVAATTPNIADFVDQVIAETNLGYINSKIPVRVKALCIEEANIDQSSASDTLETFTNMKGIPWKSETIAALRNTADAAVLLVQDFDDNYCGYGWIGTTYEGGPTFSTVKKSCALGYFTIGHELGHNFGCHHNKEQDTNKNIPFGHGHLIEGGARTIMAYHVSGYDSKVNYYSNPEVIYPGTGTPTGVEGISNNAAVITKNRFAMAALGDESSTCSSSLCHNLVGSSPLVVRKGYQLNDGKGLPNWGPEFEVKFDVKFNSLSRTRRSIVLFFAPLAPNGVVLALWTTSFGLYLGSNFQYVRLKGLQKGEWHSFVISQKKDGNGQSYYCDITVDGDIKFHKNWNPNPKQFTNVKVYAGENFRTAADAEIRNFKACQLS